MIVDSTLQHSCTAAFVAHILKCVTGMSAEHTELIYLQIT